MFNCPYCDAPLAEAERQVGRCHVCGRFLSHGETEENQGSHTTMPPAEPPEPAASIGEVVHNIVERGQVDGEQTEGELPRKPNGEHGEHRTSNIERPTSNRQQDEQSDSNVEGPTSNAERRTKEDEPQQDQAPEYESASETHNELDNYVTHMWSEDVVESVLGSVTLRPTVTTAVPVPSRHIRPREVVDLRTDHPRLADYELLEVIGEGGIGVVYGARQTAIDRTVAVKMLRGETAETDDFEKFLAEAVVTGELEHPNIVPVYDLGRSSDDTLFYSMKRVQGTPWSRAIQEKSLEENLEILMKVADAVAFAHDRGVVHRDLKPENVMLGAFGEVLVMDWGIALTTDRFPKGRMAAHLGLGGSPAYMAPEMVRGPVERIGPASDVYLLGAILFEIVTGGPPHREKSAIACLRTAARNEIAPTDKSGELLDVAMRAMATEPEDRYESVTAFQHAIRQYYSHAESLALSAHGDAEAADASRAADYQAFSRAISCYEEALVLWPENVAASAALAQITLAYAECALGKGDFELGLSLLDAENPRHRPLRQRLQSAAHERETRRQRLTNLKRIAVVLLLGMLGGALIAVVMIRAEANRAQTAEREARRNLGRAVAARAETLETLKQLDKKNDELRQEKEKVEEEKQTALTEKERATQAERDATTARDLALAATRREQQVAYVAQINLANEKIAANAFGPAREQLVGAEAEDKSRLRHWEWGRLMFLLHRDRLTLDVPGGVAALAGTADGRLLLAGSTSGSVLLIDSATGKRLLELDHGAPVQAVAIAADGAWAASGGSGGNVKIWDLKAPAAGNEKAPGAATPPPGAPRQPVKVLQSHAAAVLCLAVSRDGRRLASGSADRSVRLWDAATWQPAGDLFGHHGPVWSVDFSPDGQRLVTAGDDGSAIVWSAAERRRLVRFSEHMGSVYAARFSPDGEHVASAGDSRRILLWRPRDVPTFDYSILLTGESRKAAPFEVIGSQDALVRDLRFSPDGQRLATAGDDATVCIWRTVAQADGSRPTNLPPANPQTVNSRLVKTLRGHVDRVRCCVFLGGDAAVASGDRAGALKLWNVADYAEVQVLRGHAGEVFSARYSADGRYLVTAGRDHAAVVWDAATGRPLETLKEGHAFLAAKALFVPDGTELLTAAADNSVRLWNVQTGGEVRSFPDAGRSGAMAISADAHWLATGGAAQDGKPVCKLWNLETGQLLQTLPHEAAVTAVAFSPREPLLMTGDADGVRRLWRLESDSEAWQLQSTLSTHRGGVTAAYFLPDGSRVLSASLDHTVGQWDVRTGKEAVGEILKHSDAVTSLAVSPDGRHVLTGTADGQARLWNVAGNAWELLDTRGARPASVAFSHDGRTVAVVFEDHGMLLYNVSQPRLAPGGNAPPLAGRRPVLSGPTGAVWSAVFSPVGEGLATVGGNRAMLWDVPTGHLVRSFSPHGPVVSARFSPQGDLVATGSWDGSAKLWRLGLAPGGQASRQAAPGGRGSRRAASGAEGAAIAQRAAEDGANPAKNAGRAKGRVAAKITGEGVPAAVTSVAFAPGDPKRLLLAGADGAAVLWDVAAAKVLVAFRGHTATVNDAEFSRDGRLVVTASDDGTARIFSAATGEPLRSLAGENGHQGAVLSAVFSDDGTRVITAGRDATARVWDAADGRHLVTLAGHAAAVTSACLSSDNRRALTGSEDRTAKIWLLDARPAPEESALPKTPDTADARGADSAGLPNSTGLPNQLGGQELLTLRGHDDAVTSVTFSPDGRTIATASRDGTAMLWHAEKWSD